MNPLWGTVEEKACIEMKNVICKESVSQSVSQAIVTQSDYFLHLYYFTMIRYNDQIQIPGTIQINGTDMTLKLETFNSSPVGYPPLGPPERQSNNRCGHRGEGRVLRNYLCSVQ